MEYWLVKSEPFKYSWDKFEKDGRTFWDGVRNYQARNNLKAMQIDDLVMFYHSNEDLAVIGIAKVVKTAYQDPTTDDNKWVAVDLVPLEKLAKMVSLDEIKKDDQLSQIGLIRQSRLSVMPLKKEEFDRIIYLSAQ